MKQRIEIFSKETGIKVNYEFISATDYMTKLNATSRRGAAFRTSPRPPCPR